MAQACAAAIPCSAKKKKSWYIWSLHLRVLQFNLLLWVPSATAADTAAGLATAGRQAGCHIRSRRARAAHRVAPSENAALPCSAQTKILVPVFSQGCHGRRAAPWLSGTNPFETVLAPRP